MESYIQHIVFLQIKDMESTDFKVNQMIELTFEGENTDPEKRKNVSTVAYLSYFAKLIVQCILVPVTVPKF